MRISVFGDGAWGSALAMVLVGNGHEVSLWGAFPDYLETMSSTRRNDRFLPGVTLPEKLRFQPDIAEAWRDCDIALFATPTQFLRGVLKRLAPLPRPESRLIVNVAKGIELDSWLRISEIFRQELGEVRYAALSGPSHAEEVARGVPTLVTAASSDPEAALEVQRVFMNERFRVYTCDDVVGVELGGALKNVIAIAGGIIDGMKLGDNPKAALMTRGVSELGRLGEALGGRRETFAGLAGIGDLIVTCTSGHSRNRHVGEELGRGRRLDEILEDMGMVVAEGVPTTRGAYTLARRVGVDTPLIDEIYAVLYEGREVKTAIHSLMTRSPKREG